MFVLVAGLLLAVAPRASAGTTAERVHAAALEFCRAHPTLESLRRDGYTPVRPGATHWANFAGPARFDLDRPRQAVVRGGKLVGVLHAQALRLGGLPDFGPPARPHTHAGGRTEMLHVWCSDDPRVAFSPHGR